MRNLLRATLAAAAVAALTALSAAPAAAGAFEPFGECNGLVDVVCHVSNPDGAYSCTVFVHRQLTLGHVCV